jgi:hypothetical protein
MRVIGIDTGPIPGIVRLHLDAGRLREVEALQCTWPLASLLVASLLDDNHSEWPLTLVAVERFAIGAKSKASGRAGRITRDLVGQLQMVAQEHGARYVERTASEVKPWATDIRLAHAGLLEPTKGMTHARDAGRHALFAAVKDGGLPDPLSKGFKR